MPKTVNRPRDDIDAQQMQQGQADFAENNEGPQMGDSLTPDDSSEQQAPA